MKYKDARKTKITAEDKWEILVDLEKRLVFPAEIVVTALRPEMVMIVELTVPWEERMMEANVRKSNKYEELRQECEDAGWKARCYAIEVGCRGFARHSLHTFSRR